MRQIYKLLIFFLLILIAILVTGVYGAGHDQVSYTISPEYFTRFKFHQFGLDHVSLPNRMRAAMVGWQASWWMGLPIGLIVGGVGWIHPAPGQMFKLTLVSFALILCITALFGLGGLAYGWWTTRQLDLAAYREVWFIPEGLVHVRRFLCVGHMHNASYLGGTLAILAGIIFHIVTYYRNRMPQLALN